MIRIKGLKWCIRIRVCTFFGLCTLAFSQPRPLDNIASRQYQHEVRPLRLALDRWLNELGLQDFGLSIRLVKASDLPPNSCGMSTYDVRSLVGEIDALRSDEGRLEDGVRLISQLGLGRGALITLRTT